MQVATALYQEESYAKVPKLQPLQICKDKETKDTGLFELLRKTWKSQRTSIDLILSKPERIEFIDVTDNALVTKAF